jgi:hypothetical protein
MKKNMMTVAIALVGLGATLTSCSKPSLEEQLAGSYSVTNYDQSATVSGINLTITDQGIDPSTVINMPLGEEGMTNPLSGVLKMNIIIGCSVN